MPLGGWRHNRRFPRYAPASMPLPALPSITLEHVEDLSPADPGGFLRLARRRLRARIAGAPPSEAFVYDLVERPALDAVVVAPHFMRDGVRWVFLRSALRPPAALRPVACRPLPERDSLGLLWELPAGLVEPDECNEPGLHRCAARELEEELGFAMAPEELLPLGHSVFPSPGVIGERLHFFHVEVDPERRGHASEDGSVLERDAIIVSLRFSEALAAVRDGGIEDSKTEIGLRRLAEM
jgi:ADP-ribose pyrophosphatase